MHWKGLLVIGVVAIVAVAVASRVSFLKNIVFGSTAAPASS
jgi:hypothetical protein